MNPPLIERIRSLYEDDTPRSHRFRYALLGFDIITIAFVVVSSFFPPNMLTERLDLVFGILILGDFMIRMILERDRRSYLTRPANWADIASVVSFLAPIAGEGLGFLRVLRTLRLLHTYQTADRLRKDFPYFRAHEEIIMASINLGVFLFVMTGLIYASQVNINPEIQNYADALYFTVTALTTTGFGDITLTGTGGHMLSVLVMIFGVTLFLRLLQVLFRPTKVRQECPKCGLLLHDPDAVHCKHCGATIHIRTEGEI